MPDTQQLPGINWLKWLTLSALTVGAILSALLAFTIYLVGQNAHDLARENAQTRDICQVVKAIDPIIVKAHNQTQQALDDGTIARLIAKGDLQPHSLVDAVKNVKTYGDAHATLLGLTCGEG